ncbi:Fic family protein [Clostridium baratii]
MKPYIPFKLPLDNYFIDTAELLNPVVNATKQMAVYVEKIKSSKVNPDLLINFLSLKEALESSRIEGTQATMDDMLESNINNINMTSDVQEVFNYLEALYTGEGLLNRRPISSRFIKELHRCLMSNGVRGSIKAPGEFRTIQNFVGKPGCTVENASYVPPEPQLLDDYLTNLENYINSDDNLNELIKIAIIHAQFETIHPFLDGNGRIGRILIPLYLYSKNVLDSPTFFVSGSLERDKFKYYQLLNNIRVTVDGLNSLKDISDIDKEEQERQLNIARKNYTEWIKFFLNACETECNKSIDKIRAIDTLYEVTLNTSKELIKNTKVIDIINCIFENPIFTANTIKSKINIAPSTLNNYLNKLVEANIIFTNTKKRNKAYYFYDLINILR